jgi:hypothetical protein
MTVASTTITKMIIPGTKSVMLKELLLAEPVEEDVVVTDDVVEAVEVVIVVDPTARTPF